MCERVPHLCQGDQLLLVPLSTQGKQRTRGCVWGRGERAAESSPWVPPSVSGFTSTPGSAQGQDPVVLGRGEGLDSSPRAQERGTGAFIAGRCSQGSSRGGVAPAPCRPRLPAPEQPGFGRAGPRTPPCGQWAGLSSSQRLSLAGSTDY